MTDPVQPAGAPTPGIKTTEFWLSAAAAFLGALLTVGAWPETGPWSWVPRVAGVLSVALASMGYSASRARVKAP